MHATIYGRGQMVIPAKARKEARIGKGDIVDVQIECDGRIVLVRMEKPKPSPRGKVRLIRRKGKHAILVGGPRLSSKQVREALSDFP